MPFFSRARSLRNTPVRQECLEGELDDELRSVRFCRNGSRQRA